MVKTAGCGGASRDAATSGSLLHKAHLVPVGFRVLRRSVCLIMTEPPGFHVANVHAVEAGYRQDRLHDALGILLSGFTVRQKPASPLTVATMPLSFSPLSEANRGSISTTVGRTREILIPNLQSGWRILPRSITLSLRERDRPAVVAVPVKRQRRIKNTHRFFLLSSFGYR